MGESTFVLDSLSVEDAMRLIGAAKPGEATRASAPDSEDWRATLRAAGATPPTVRAPRAQQPPAPRADPPPAVVATPSASPPPVRRADFAPPASDTVAGELPPDGITVGSASADLFGGPLGGASTLDDIAKLVAGCRACGLHATAKNPVPGEGNANAKLVCVGEAPGQTEDELGRPFVGAAGQLLTKILAAIDLPREEVFICNVLKHRPPGNRNPAPDEIVACRPFLMRQLDLLRPRVILALGTFAAQTLLETNLAIGKLRGQVHRFYGIPLIVTYHPAALLRNPNWKRPTWDDVKLARRLLDRNADGA